MKILALLLGMTLAVGPPSRAQPAPVRTYENLNATLWAQQSAEWMALSLQTFEAAYAAMKAALAQPGWTAAVEQEAPYRELPPAIILDLDETVLDNSSFRVKLIRDGAAYSETAWEEWVKQEKALAMPGAVEFLNAAHAEGVTLFYVTNRVCDASSPADHTRALLAKLHFPLNPARLLCRTQTTESSNKSPRRARVARTHRVLLLLGDDLNDFVTVASTGDWKERVEARTQAARAHREKWGARWFILPNPMYGSWERAIGEPVQTKLDALRP